MRRWLKSAAHTPEAAQPSPRKHQCPDSNSTAAFASTLWPGNQPVQALGLPLLRALTRILQRLNNSRGRPAEKRREPVWIRQIILAQQFPVPK